MDNETDELTTVGENCTVHMATTSLDGMYTAAKPTTNSHRLKYHQLLWKNHTDRRYKNCELSDCNSKTTRTCLGSAPIRVVNNTTIQRLIKAIVVKAAYPYAHQSRQIVCVVTQTSRRLAGDHYASVQSVTNISIFYPIC